MKHPNQSVNYQSRKHASRLSSLLLALLVAVMLMAGCAAPYSSSSTAGDSGDYVMEAPASEAFYAAPTEPCCSTGGTSPVNGEAYDAVFFQNYGVNPFIDTEDDHLSTFAMDVDSASYTVARRYLTDGNLPDPDSVRTEEFINYFGHDYAPPAPGEGAFAIHLEGSPSPFGGERYSLMRVGLQGRVISAEDRKDASLVFVVDTSGSMVMENRLGLVKRSLRLLVDELRPTDEVAIVEYGSRARVILRPTSGENRDAILRGIDGLISNGSTNAEEGLRLGYDIAREMAREGRITRVILASDGVANVGNTGPDAILETIRQGAENDDIYLSAVGVGMGNYSDILLERLANDGDGTYAYVDTLEEARRIFVGNLTGTLQTIAKDAKIQVDFNPELVSRYRLMGYENRRVDDDDFRNDEVDAGEVGAGHSVTALYEIKLVEDVADAGGDGSIATVAIRYEDPDTGNVHEVNQGLLFDGFAATFDEASLSFQWDAAVAEFAEILRESYWAQDGDLSAVRQLAQTVSVGLSDSPDASGDEQSSADRAEFVYLVAQAERILGR